MLHEGAMLNHTGKYVYSLEIPVRWYDMDAFGHVNNSVFFTYFEQIRIAWLDEIKPAEMTYDAIGPVLVTANCNYYRPIVYPDNLLVYLYANIPGRSSYILSYQIYSKNDSKILYADGTTKVVWVDRLTGRSVSVPNFVRSQLPEENTK